MQKIHPRELRVLREERSGLTVLVLPDGSRQTYTREQLAGMVVDAVEAAHARPETLSEEYVETLKVLVGTDRWEEAMSTMLQAWS